jgi:hypothetical protein
MAQMVECLPGKYQTMNSNPSTLQKQNQEGSEMSHCLPTGLKLVHRREYKGLPDSVPLPLSELSDIGYFQGSQPWRNWAPFISNTLRS